MIVAVFFIVFLSGRLKYSSWTPVSTVYGADVLCDSDPAHTTSDPNDPDPAHHKTPCPVADQVVVTPSLPQPAPSPVPPTSTVTDQTPVTTGVACDPDPAHTTSDPNDPDPAHHRELCSTVSQSTPNASPSSVNPPIAPTPLVTPTDPLAILSATNPLAGLSFYRFPYTPAQNQVSTWLGSQPANAAKILQIASQPQAHWLVSSDINATVSDVKQVMSLARAEGKVPLFVAYNIPYRDCGNYSAGGSQVSADYIAWIKGLSTSIGRDKAVVILEPDALTLTDCLDPTAKAERYALINQAVDTLTSQPETRVYIDAGHPEWISTPDMAARLRVAGISKADGFALNVSSFYDTASNIVYGTEISRLTDNKHFVIDTSRNGGAYTSSLGWCNPAGQLLGAIPTTNFASSSLVDALMWIKNPGESDGLCNNGPNAGVWWADYALSLVR